MSLATIKKYLVLICMATAAILIIIAASLYPGGSLSDKNSIGFAWSRNFLSNLFSPTAINGSRNPGWIWALVGMVFLSVGYGAFFFHMAKKISSRIWAGILRYIGAANLLFIILIATPLHDLGVISIVLTLIGLFTVTVLIFKSRLQLLKASCVICLLSYYCFFTAFGFGYVELTAILQKVYVVCSIILVLGLEYFTNYEDFKPRS